MCPDEPWVAEGMGAKKKNEKKMRQNIYPAPQNNWNKTIIQMLNFSLINISSFYITLNFTLKHPFDTSLSVTIVKLPTVVDMQ